MSMEVGIAFLIVHFRRNEKYRKQLKDLHELQLDL